MVADMQRFEDAARTAMGDYSLSISQAGDYSIGQNIWRAIAGWTLALGLLGPNSRNGGTPKV